MGQSSGAPENIGKSRATTCRAAICDVVGPEVHCKFSLAGDVSGNALGAANNPSDGGATVDVAGSVDVCPIVGWGRISVVRTATVGDLNCTTGWTVELGCCDDQNSDLC